MKTNKLISELNSESRSELRLSDPDTVSDELLPEYRFDYSKARPNRFVSRSVLPQATIALDPDVAAVFTTQEAVNTVLRALIQTMPQAIHRETA